MMKKRLLICLVLSLLLAGVPLCGLAAVPSAPMEAFYVNDFADVISDADRRAMLAMGQALEDATGAQVVAVTVRFLDGMDMEEYCYQLFDKWGIGEAKKNNGVLLLISIGDREIRTVVGRGMEKELPASVTDSYTDEYAYSYLENDDFSTGLRENYRALCEKVASVYGKSLAGANSDQNVGNGAYSFEFMDGGIDFMWIGIALFVLAIIFSIVRSVFRAAWSAPGCLFGWILGQGMNRGYGHRPRPPFFMGGPHHHPGPRPPRPRPPMGPGS
ncbi:MAG: TPM domain-containing protein, partial [Firmicutes bacterium]|nr:TPM domain-containing protein [Bacillota bacterium]